MTAIAKSAKRHPAAKKCCGWEEPTICSYQVIGISRGLSVTINKKNVDHILKID